MDKAYYNKYLRVTCWINNYVTTTHTPLFTLHSDKLTTTTIKMTTTTNSNISVYIAKTSAVNSASFFDVFQDTTIRSRKLTIRKIISPTISAKPYPKAMIAIIVFVVFFLSLLSLPFKLAI